MIRSKRGRGLISGIWKRDFVRSALPGVVAVLYYAYLQSHIALIDGDTIKFFTQLDKFGFIPFLIMRYNAWSSRLIIEGVLALLAHAPMLWFVLNLLIYLSIWFCLRRVLAVRVDYERSGWLALFLMAFYQFSNFASAGWMATMLNYLWPLAALLFIICEGLSRTGLADELVPEKKKENGRYPQTGKSSAAISLLAALFVANLEQGAVLLCIISTCFALIAWRKQRSVGLYAAWLIISIAGIVFALTCPGNAVRAVSEVGTWWPAYDQLSFAGKIANGLEATTDRYLFGRSTLLLFMTLVLVITVWNESCSWRIRLAAVGSLAIQLIIPELVRRGYLVQPALNGEPVVLAILVVGLLPFLLDLIVLVSLFGKTTLAGFVATLCCGAFASRMVLAFSPTLFASSYRTFIFLDYSLIFVVALLLARFDYKGRSAAVLNAAIVWFAALEVQSAIAYVTGA